MAKTFSFLARALAIRADWAPDGYDTSLSWDGAPIESAGESVKDFPISGFPNVSKLPTFYGWYPDDGCAKMLRGVGSGLSAVFGHPNAMLRLALRSGTILAVATALGAQGLDSAAHAQGRLDARYTASLAGLSIGKGAWVIDIGNDKYLAAASGATAGIMRLFASGDGTGAAHGSVVNGQLIPASYSATISSNKRKNEVRIALKAGAVKDIAVFPPARPDSERVPLRAVHRRGVTDPMTASLVRATGKDPLAPASCQHRVSVFDGRMRYDLHLAYKRTEEVKAQKGYAGPALVCAVHFSPIAGYVPDRVAIKYLAEQRDIEAWLVPIAGTSILVPFRVTVPTPFGLGVVEATQFLTAARPARAAVSDVTSQ